MAQQGVKENSAGSGAKPGKTAAQGADSQDSIRETTGLTDFPGEEIPRKVQRIIATQAVSGYPALVDEKNERGHPYFPHRGRAGTFAAARYYSSSAAAGALTRTVRERPSIK